MSNISRELAEDDLTAPCDSAEFYLLGLLTTAENTEFEEHLKTNCPGCRKRLRNHEEMLAHLAMQEPVTPSGELRERLRARLHQPATANAPPAAAGVIVDQLGLLVVRSEDMNWQAGPVPGVWIKPLFVDQEKMYATNLVRLGPGVHYPAHRHAEVEEVYMLAGDLKFKNLQLGQGDYCRAEGGTCHSESISTNGCLLLITTSIHDELLTGA